MSQESEECLFFTAEFLGCIVGIFIRSMREKANEWINKKYECINYKNESMEYKCREPRGKILAEGNFCVLVIFLKISVNVHQALEAFLRRAGWHGISLEGSERKIGD